MDLFGPEGNKIYTVDHWFEHFSYKAIWVLPVIFMLSAFFVFLEEIWFINRKTKQMNYKCITFGGFCKKSVRKTGALLVLILTGCYSGMAQYTPGSHRMIEAGEIPVDRPGFYGKRGATYVLTGDIVSDRSGIFLGNDVTFDLNGYTLTFAGGDYSHIPNSGFEQGIDYWDLRKAPGAKVKNTKDLHVFIGDKLLSLEKWDEVVSEYVYLLMANRSYYAMCGITGHHFRDMKGDLANEKKTSLYVEDKKEIFGKVDTGFLLS